jgi:hypothetical protein
MVLRDATYGWMVGATGDRTCAAIIDGKTRSLGRDDVAVVGCTTRRDWTLRRMVCAARYWASAAIVDGDAGALRGRVPVPFGHVRHTPGNNRGKRRWAGIHWHERLLWFADTCLSSPLLTTCGVEDLGVVVLLLASALQEECPRSANPPKYTWAIDRMGRSRRTSGNVCPNDHASSASTSGLASVSSP